MCLILINVYWYDIFFIYEIICSLNSDVIFFLFLWVEGRIFELMVMFSFVDCSLDGSFYLSILESEFDCLVSLVMEYELLK